MKALSMLDHVMLWVSRIFAFILLVQVLFVLQEICGAYYYASHHHSGWNAHQFIWRMMVESQNYELLFLLFVTVLWNISAWWLRKDAGRLYLFLSGAVMFSGYAYQLIDLLIMHPNLPTGQEWLSAVSSSIGFLAIAWTGFRAPYLPPMKWMLSIPRRQVIPLSANLFRTLSPSV